MLFRILIFGDSDVSLDVQANNWLMALRQGLDEKGLDRAILKRSICEIVSESKVVLHTKDGTKAFEISMIGRAESGQVSVGEAEVSQGQAPSSGTLYPRSLTPNNVLEVTSEVPVMSEDSLPWSDSSHGSVRISEAPTAIDIQAIDDQFMESDIPNTGHPPDQALVATIDPSLEQTVITSLVDDETAAEVDKLFDQSIPENLADLKHMSKPVNLYDSGTDLLTQVFEEIQDIDLVGDALDDGLQFALELAVRRIPSDSGWLLLSDLNRNDLFFAAATGSSAEDVIDFRIPVGHGVIGYCAETGVSLSLTGDQISLQFPDSLFKAVNYPVTSLLCVPLQHEGRTYGVLQLMNAQSDVMFSAKDLEAVAYIAQRTAEFLATRIKR